MKKYLLLIIIILLTIPIIWCVEKDKIQIIKGDFDTNTGCSTMEVKCSNYTFTLVKSPAYDKGYIIVSKDGRIIYANEEILLHFRTMENDRKKLDERFINKDLTGDGIPNLALFGYPDGIQGDCVVYIYDLGDNFRLKHKIKKTVPKFKDLNGDSYPEIICLDSAFAYWRTSGGSSPYPKVIFSPKNGKYSISVDLMKKPTPSEIETKKRINEIKQMKAWKYPTDKKGYPPPEMWGYMLHLIYSKNSALAWSFMDSVWPDHLKNIKQEFLKEFLEQLSSSKYWEFIVAFNKEDKVIAEYAKEKRKREEEKAAVDSLNKQIEKFNANRMPNMGVTPIDKRVSRVEYDSKLGQIATFDQDGKPFFVLKRETDGRFKGTVKTPYHQAAFSGPGGSHSWGHVLAEFYLKKGMF